MNLSLPEYRAVRVLRVSGNSRVIEAVDERDARRVVVKVYDIEDPSVEDRVLHEFELLERLDVPGVVAAHELRRAGDQLALVLDHVPGVELAEYAGDGPIELARFWPIAIQLADILAQTHAQRVVHRDIKPTNVIVDERGEVKLVDFGISVLLAGERRRIYDEEVLVGTLPYVSPEQTGRTRRAVDLRSDIYSLGVTFYELLTGHLPFEGLSPHELIHAHLARRPRPPKLLRASLPEALSRLVLKLLEKTPEHRYQSGAGLSADLRRIRERVDRGEPTEDFELGVDDVSPRLRLPGQLYGRAHERATLLDEYRAVVESGGTRTIVLTGPVGVGKSALLDVLAIAVAGDGGYLGRGAFTSFRELPYSGFIEAIAGLVEQLLTESDAHLARWRRRLEDRLGPLTAVACELVPALGLVLGEQAPAPTLEPIEARNRLRLTLERLLATLCEDKRPLVLALEDLQQADDASLALLETLLAGSVGPLLMVASARVVDGEPEATAVAMLLRTDAPRPAIRRLSIAPLPVEAIAELVADMLGRTAVEVESLAEIVARKTGGIPLFITRFLVELVDEQVLRPEASGWSWDAVAVEARQIPDDALAMMNAKLSALEPEARVLIGRAACIGDRFDLAQLSTLSDRPRAELAALCFDLVDQGLLSSLGGHFCFAHESLREAGLAQLPPEERRQLRWTIGRHLLARSELVDDALFEIVDHLEAGAPSELDEDLRVELVRLELRAGERGLSSGAYALALRYVEHGIERIASAIPGVRAEGTSAEHYELVFGLHFVRAQALALANLRGRADEAFDALLSWRLLDHHFGRIVARRCRILRENNRAGEAVKLGLAAMARLGMQVPAAPSRARILLGLARLWWAFGARGAAQMESMPPCTDERTAALIDLVAELKYSAFSVDNTLTLYLGGQHVRLILRHGFHDSAPAALADVAIIVSVLGRPGQAIDLVDAALELSARSEVPVRSRLGVVAPGAAVTLHRGRPFSEVAQLVEANYPIALELGEFDQASLLAMMICHTQMEIGMHLAVLERRCRELGEVLERWGSKQAIAVVWLVRCWCASLLGRLEGLEDVRALGPESMRERGGAHSAVYIAHVNRALLLLIMGETRRAVADTLEFIDEVAKAAMNSWFVARAALIITVSVARLRLAGEQPPAGAGARVRKNLRLLSGWAEAGPESYGHYFDLARGAWAAADGRFEVAVDQLERAWARARQRGCRWVEGLAAECLAELLEGRELELLAEGAWRRCWQAYSLWGADAKLELLRSTRSALFPNSDQAEASRSTVSSSIITERSSESSLDLGGVLESVGVLTEDLGIEQVIRRVLDAAMTSAGADHGMLLLEDDGRLNLVAKAGDAREVELVEDMPALSEAADRVPASLVNLVARTNQWLVLDDACEDPRFVGDPYFEAHAVRSILALPILKRERRLGVLVLENHLASHAFTLGIIETLRLITGQAASIIDNARLYAALGRSEARWRSLVGSAPDVIALLDERGEVALLNRSGPFADLATEDEAREGGLSPESAERWRGAVEFVLERGQPFELELEFVAATGESSWYEARLAPIEGTVGFEAGREVGNPRRNAVVVATDVSARKRADAERRQLEAQLRQQQRLDSIGTLASGVAHEINNPIQGIMNYAELIHGRSSDSAVVEEFAGEIIHESKRVATIVRSLLAFSRQERGHEREEVELDAIVDATLSLIRSILRKDHIILDVHRGEHRSRVRCDPQAVQQVVMNLITNARDALNECYAGYNERKRIDVRIGQVERDGRSWGRVSVEDLGPGIPEHVLARIFDPFFTTKDRDHGTGLGLAVSHGIVRENEGELSVETRVSEGTRFHLDLPLVE